jgi:membrane-bound lytic murein transglycosylase B
MLVAVAAAIGGHVLGDVRAASRQDPVRQPFDAWLSDLRQEALSRGISEEVVSKALDGIETLPVVVERDRTQAERTLSLDEYLRRRLSPKTLRTARQMRAKHRSLLARVSKKYGVPAGLLVSIWGLESTFGRFSGVRPTVAALATLAYDNRRAALFRSELLAALEILEKSDVEPERMKGSWAGAMGQPQFMPSSYLKYAVDFDGDRRRDIWGSLPDVFGSIANFLVEHGWKRGQSWGRAVKVPASAEAKIAKAAPLRTEGCEAERQMSEPLTLAQWRRLGVTRLDKAAWPKLSTTASLVRAGSRNFLVFDNYEALLEYNCAHAYALSVALLSEGRR